MTDIPNTTFIEVIVPPRRVSVIEIPDGAFGPSLKGEKGDPGDPGPPGSGGLTFGEVEEIAAANGQIQITLPNTPGLSVFQVFINGLRQGLSDVSLVGNIVTLSAALEIVAGDKVNLVYSHP